MQPTEPHQNKKNVIRPMDHELKSHKAIKLLLDGFELNMYFHVPQYIMWYVLRYVTNS